MKKIRELGIGADIENISRFRKFNSNSTFLHKIFTKKELSYCFKGKPAHHLAARFAGKEAVIKALSSMSKNIEHKDIEILNDKKGVPKVKLNVTDFSDSNINISLSHCKDKALAFAVVRR